MNPAAKTEKNEGGHVMERPHSGVILLDVPPGGDGEFDASFLERTGHPVVVCHGPADQPCPLLGGQACPKYDAAHGIVFELDLELAQHRAIIERYRALGRPDLPIRVVVRPDQAERYRDTLAGVELWTREPTVADLDGFAARVEAADRFTD
jgi:hypothetical protein